MRPGLAQRVQDVGRREQPRGGVELGGAHAGGVAGAVGSLVMPARRSSPAARAPATGPGCDPSDRGAAGRAPTPPDAAVPVAPRCRSGRPRGRGRAPARRGTPAPGRPVRPGRRSSGEPGHSTRVAVEPGRLQVGRVAEPGERLVECGVVAEGTPRCRLGIDHRRPQVVRARALEQLRRRLAEDRGDRRIERPPGPALDRVGRDDGAADGVEHDGREADRREPGRLRDVLARKAGWARRGRRSARSRRGRRGPRRPAAAGAGSARAPTSQSARDALGEERRRPRARLSIRSRPAPSPRPARKRSASVGRVGIDQVAAGADQDVVAAEPAASSCDVAAQPAKRRSVA